MLVGVQKENEFYNISILIKLILILQPMERFQFSAISAVQCDGKLHPRRMSRMSQKHIIEPCKTPSLMWMPMFHYVCPSTDVSSVKALFI